MPKRPCSSGPVMKLFNPSSAMAHPRCSLPGCSALLAALHQFSAKTGTRSLVEKSFPRANRGAVVAHRQSTFSAGSARPPCTACAAATKAAIRAASLTPGALSTPDEHIDLPRAGQPHRLGHVLRRQAPRQHPGPQPLAPDQKPPVEGQPVAARQDGALRGAWRRSGSGPPPANSREARPGPPSSATPIAFITGRP